MNHGTAAIMSIMSTMAMVKSLTIRIPTSEKRALKSLFSAKARRVQDIHACKDMCTSQSVKLALAIWQSGLGGLGQSCEEKYGCWLGYNSCSIRLPHRPHIIGLTNIQSGNLAIWPE